MARSNLFVPFKWLQVNHEDDEGTPLIHYAVANGSQKIVKLLIKNNVELKARDQYGLTALVYALKNKNKEIVEIIKSAGGRY